MFWKITWKKEKISTVFKKISRILCEKKGLIYFLFFFIERSLIFCIVPVVAVEPLLAGLRGDHLHVHLLDQQQQEQCKILTSVQ